MKKVISLFHVFPMLYLLGRGRKGCLEIEDQSEQQRENVLLERLGQRRQKTLKVIGSFWMELGLLDFLEDSLAHSR